ncbi:MAG: amidohydrolase family protein [Nitrospirae bacterium]|nr:amidohydrolase family protein [Nitrospirota bacterium]
MVSLSMLAHKGIMDLHTHGIGNYDTRTKNPEDILKIASLHGRAGTSAILPTVYSGAVRQMRENMEAVRRAMQAQGVKGSRGQGVKRGEKKILNLTQPSTFNLQPSSLILGVHLEGPFLNPTKCGALNKGSFIKPSISSLKKLIDGYEDIIKIITIAPELPGALKVIKKCASMGIRVNMGHSDATYKQALDGKKAGARSISHIFNAMRQFHHREPGLAGFGLLDEEIYIEVIADGIHLSPDVLRFIFKIKPHDRILLVSDSIKGAKDKKGAIYTKNGVLAGSSISLADAVRNLKNLGIPEAEALKSAVKTPKKYLTA